MTKEDFAAAGGIIESGKAIFSNDELLQCLKVQDRVVAYLEARPSFKLALRYARDELDVLLRMFEGRKRGD